MERFEYASPTTVKEATALLGPTWNDAQVLAGGTDLISMMKDFVASPKRVVNIKVHSGTGRHPDNIRSGVQNWRGGDAR